MMDFNDAGRILSVRDAPGDMPGRVIESQDADGTRRVSHMVYEHESGETVVREVVVVK